MSNKIAVELQLKLQGLAAQAKQAARIVKENIGTAGAGAGINAGIDKATKSQDNLTKSVKATTAALKEQAAAVKLAALAEAQATVDRLRAARETAGRRMGIPAWMGPEQAQKFTDPVEAAERKRMANQLRAQRNASRNTGGGLATNPAAMFGYQGPPPPVIAPPVIAPGAGAPTPPGVIGSMRNALLPIGQILASLSMIKRAIDVILEPLRKFAAMVMRAADAAGALYANSVRSGFNLQQGSTRASIGRVLGVSEHEIFIFGAQMEKLIPKLRVANATFARTAPELTSLSWEMKVLKENTHALFAEISSDVAPAFKTLALAINGITSAVTRFLQIPMVKGFLSTAGSGVASAINSLTGNGVAPSPVGIMRQMPAANWEHMGLQVGGSGAMQFAATTARATTRTADGVQALLAAMRENKFNITKPVGYPSRS